MASNIDETPRPALTSTPRQQNLSRIASDPRWFSVLSVVLLFTAWYLGTEVLHAIPSNFLPSPLQLGREFIDLWEHGYAGTPLWDHVLTSLLRMLTGFMLSVLVAVPLGLLMGSSPRVRAFLNPIFNSLRPVPSIALIPLDGALVRHRRDREGVRHIPRVVSVRGAQHLGGVATCRVAWCARQSTLARRVCSFSGASSFRPPFRPS